MADHLSLVSVVVDDYDEAIAFFADTLGFELVEDSPSTTNSGAPKRWNQTAGRVGFFLTVDDFEARYHHMVSAGVVFTSSPRTEPYGTVAVFLDIAGNKWDLLGPA